MSDFWIGSRQTGQRLRESHLAFSAPDRGAVTAIYDAEVASGAEVLFEPRERPEFHAGYFAAFVRVPDGNYACHQ